MGSDLGKSRRAGRCDDPSIDDFEEEQARQRAARAPRSSAFQLRPLDPGKRSRVELEQERAERVLETSPEQALAYARWLGDDERGWRPSKAEQGRAEQGALASMFGFAAPRVTAPVRVAAKRQSGQRDDDAALAQALAIVEADGEGEGLAATTLAAARGELGEAATQVRVHASGLANQAARLLGARAFTIGNHIYFAAGEYAPGTRGGDQLLRHELTHVAQHQRGGQASGRSELLSSTSHDEREAEAAEVLEWAAVKRPAGQSGQGKRAERAAAGVRGAGAPLPYLEVLQPLFGEHDLSGVRAHQGGEAAAATERLGTRAYVLGDDVAFGGAPELRVVAHEAAHVVQQRAGVLPDGGRGRRGDALERQADAVAEAVVAGHSAAGLLAALPGGGGGGVALQLFDEADYEGMEPVAAVRKALDDDEADDALTLMRRLSAAEATTVLASYQAQAVSCFGNDNMGEATEILVGKGGTLTKALEWMFDEGTSWSLLKRTISACSNASHKTAVRTNGWRDKFVGELNNDEMAELVDLLGGDVAFKLGWMFEEGTSWTAIKTKVQAAPVDELTALRTNGWRDKFVGELGNDEIAELVDLLGGDVAFKLGWMFEEGTDWDAIKTKVEAAPEGELAALRTNTWRDKFIGELGNDEIAELVDLLGGDLAFKLGWMFEEGTDWDAIKEKVNAAPQAERDGLRNNTWRDKFVGELTNDEIAELVDLLGGNLGFKLEWMFEEGTDWDHIKAKINAAPQPERDALSSNTWRDRFVGELTNNEMAELMDLLGFDLHKKLQWMAEEGTDWAHIKAKINAAPADQRVALYDHTDMRDLFVSECNNKEMAEAVGLLGGTLVQQLGWMSEEGSDAALIKARVDAMPAADRLAVYGDATSKTLIRECDPITTRVLIIEALGGTPAQQMDLFGNMPAIRLLTWATPSADWVTAIMAARTDALDLLEVAKGDAAGWAPHIRPQLATLLGGLIGTVYPTARVDVVWAAYDTGATFNAAQTRIVFRAIFGRALVVAGQDITRPNGFLKRKRYQVIDADDATMRELMMIVKNMGRAEVAAAPIAFCPQVHEESWGITTGWTITSSAPLGTSYYLGNGYIVIRVDAAGHMDTNTIGNASDGNPNAYANGLSYFRNHVRHEIGHAVGDRTFGSMSESGNDFATAYGGWKSSSKSSFTSAMWVATSAPASGWPTVTFAGGVTATVSDDQARDWCVGLLADGEECAGPIKSAPGTIQQKLTALATPVVVPPPPPPPAVAPPPPPMPALWSGQRAVQYLQAVGANSGADLRDRGFKFPGFVPTSTVHIYADRSYDGFATYDKSAYDKLLTGTGWYSLSSPVEMFAEMYTQKYESNTTPAANNGKDPATFFTQLEATRDPMFGEPPPDPPDGP